MEPNIIQENSNQPTPPIMPKQRKQISTWVGFLIIIIFAVVVFGGVFVWQYVETQNNNVIVKNEIVGRSYAAATICETSRASKASAHQCPCHAGHIFR